MILSSTSSPKRKNRQSVNLSISSLSSASSINSPIAALDAFKSPPPPSPGLPSLLPRHGKKGQSPSRIEHVLRILFFFLSLALVFTYGMRLCSYGLSRLEPHHASRPTHYFTPEGEMYEMVGATELPDHPSTVVATAKAGKSKWTVYIPRNSSFPLQPHDYRQICNQARDVSMNLGMLKPDGTKAVVAGHHPYYWTDPNFLDVSEAEAEELLPVAQGWRMPEGLVGQDKIEWERTQQGMGICEKSLTYVMETSQAGFGNTLMGLWMAYGLAEKEGRAFFIDDTRWPYGKYTSYFAPPPMPKCLPPPPSHILPCPHQARHLMISATTVREAFGHAFNDEYEDPRKMEVYRQHNIFAMLRRGYEDLFKLSTDDAAFLAKRIKEMNDPVHEKGGMTFGLHVRHGDRHPIEYQYSKDYLPLSRYYETAANMLHDQFSKSNKSKSSAKDEHLVAETASKIYVASDDPTVYESSEMSHALRAQGRIVLATKATLEKAGHTQDDARAKDKGGLKGFSDEIVGWEGGFYKDIFWSLGKPPPKKPAQRMGRPRQSPSAGLAPKDRPIKLDETTPAEQAAADDDRKHPSPAALQLRGFVARAYLLDLALIASTDRVVCGVSAMGCRIIAVMMGWDRAIAKGEWVNIDGQFDWRGIDW